MILTRIRLHPFAGTSDRSMTLRPGLNVILGPNEAGKSTLVSALTCAMFQRVDLTPARFRDTLQRFLPLGSGDTVRVTLAFAVDGKEYTLEKSWGGARNACLMLPDGGEISGPDQVDETVRRLLGLSQGTYENVLFTYQSQLSGTVSLLKKSSDARVTLSDILRQSLFKADGVSVDRLQEMTAKKVEQYFSRWNTQAARPEGGRDIDHPWQVGVGTILEAYYAFRTVDRDFMRAEEYEMKIDQYSLRITALETDVRALEAFVAENSAMVDDMRARGEITKGLELVKRDLRELKEVQQKWPRCDEQMKILDEQVASLRSGYENLKAELANAEEYGKQKSLREKLEQAHQVHSEVVAEENEVKKFCRIPDAELKAMGDLERELNTLAAKLDARVLRVHLTSTKGLRATIAGAGETPRELRIGPGEEFDGTVKGSLHLQGEEWGIEVRPGDDDAVALATRVVQARDELAGRLLALGANTVEEARSKREALLLRENSLAAKQKMLLGITGEGGIARLEAAVAALPQVSLPRSSAVISEELANVTAEGMRKREELNALKGQCAFWAEKYSSQEALLDLLVARSTEEKDLLRDLSRLRPVPENVSDVSGFVAEFDTRKRKLEAKRRELFDLQLERKEFEKNEPEMSKEDLKDLLVSARSRFEEAQRQGAAYKRIQEELKKLLVELDRNTFQPLQRRFEALVSSLTAQKYSQLGMSDSLPETVRVGGAELPVELLSVGTLDVLALAVRLGMAEFYLDGRDGFLLMDDPLVNLDPKRQQAASKHVADFAASKQIIILTCHPSHAALLGGHLIEV